MLPVVGLVDNEKSIGISKNCWLAPQKAEGWSTGVPLYPAETFATEEVGFFGLKLLQLARELNQQAVRQNTSPTLEKDCFIILCKICARR